MSDLDGRLQAELDRDRVRAAVGAVLTLDHAADAARLLDDLERLGLGDRLDPAVRQVWEILIERRGDGLPLDADAVVARDPSLRPIVTTLSIYATDPRRARWIAQDLAREERT